MHSKVFRRILSVLLVLAMIGSFLVSPVSATTSKNKSVIGNEPVSTQGVNSAIVIDDDPTGGYEGDYVVIYNPATTYSTSYSTGTMTGLIQTSVNTNASQIKPMHNEATPYKIDIDAQLEKMAETAEVKQPAEEIQASYNVGATKTFSILSSYSPTGSGSVQFKCLYVGQHCYIWTPTSTASNVYPLDSIDETYAKQAADEFDGKFDLMQSSFGNHTNGTSGDGKLHILYYNIDDGWTPGQGYVAGFFYRADISNNGLPILNIDTYPAVYYKNSNGVVSKSIKGTFNTTVHEYQHLINYSNTSKMNSWLNECFSAAAEEICYPGSSVVGRIQSWMDYYYSDNNNWLNPPTEVAYNSSFNLHTGYSLYNWNNNLSDVLALYGQVSLFAQYLFSRYGNNIYKEISANFNGYDSEPNAITAATGMNCSDLARDFRIALTANAVQSVYNGRFGFKVQNNYNPTSYHNVQNPYSLLVPIVFTGSSCSIKGGGAITVKPVNGVYNPPAGANANLKYYGIKLGAAAPTYTVSAVSNNTSYGTVSVNGNVITASPKTGYYAAGYTVTSGTATVAQNGNTFTVTPSSNCTVRINFAAKTTVTVTCMANGSTYTTLTPYSGETFTLPSNATYVSGYTFVGWSNSTVAETTTAPSYFAPGASVSASSNATVYAVYTRTTSTGAGNSYELVTAAPTDWTGKYVITYGTTSSMYLLKGVTPSSNGASIENSSNVATYANAGVTLSNNQLSNVSNTYLFNLAKHGNYYSVQNVSTGTYLGMTTGSYLAAYNTYTSTYCDWTPGVGSNASSMKSAANGSYPYLSFTTGSKYFWSGSSANTSIRLWKQAGSTTTYYTTSPSGNTHTHSYGSWYSNNNGTHSRTCSCGDKQTANCTYTDVVTAPTTTSYGYTTHTCTVCGYSYKDNYTDPIVTTTYYTVTFSVPSGVTAPASKTVEANSYITLPTASAPSGYTFKGWVTSAVSSTTTMPSYLTGSYKVTGNVTLRALYSYTTTSGGSNGYALVTSAPSDWTGSYVITYGTTSSSMYLLKGVTPSSNGASIESASNSVSYANAGVTLSNNVLTNVGNAYIFKMAKHGSYYSVQNVSTGTYLGMTTKTYLGAYNTYTATYCDWTPGTGSNASSMKSAASGSYPYLSFTTSSKYFWSNSSANTSVRLWKLTTTGGSSTTYYTTG